MAKAVVAAAVDVAAVAGPFPSLPQCRPTRMRRPPREQLLRAVVVALAAVDLVAVAAVDVAAAGAIITWLRVRPPPCLRVQPFIRRPMPQR